MGYFFCQDSLTEFQVAMSFHHYRSEREWEKFKAEVAMIDRHENYRSSGGTKLFSSGFVVVNGIAGTGYEMLGSSGDKYLLIRVNDHSSKPKSTFQKFALRVVAAVMPRFLSWPRRR